jgi:hypothetical protein
MHNLTPAPHRHTTHHPHHTTPHHTSYSSLVVEALESVDPAAAATAKLELDARKQKSAAAAAITAAAAAATGDGSGADSRESDATPVKALTPAEARKLIDRVNIKTEEIPGTVFIRNLPEEVDPVELQQVLEEFGPVTSLRAVMDKKTRMPNGTAFADFENEDDAKALERAARKTGVQLNGKAFSVKMALSKTGVHAIQEHRTTRPDRDANRKAKEMRKKNRGRKRAGKKGPGKDADGGYDSD